MPRIGVRTGVTYLLVLANIAALATGNFGVEVNSTALQWVQNAGLLALGFFFKGSTEPPAAR